MISFDDITKKQNIKEHNQNWQQIPDHLYRILIIEGSGSGKTSSIFNLITQQPDIDKIYLYANDPCEVKYQLLVKKGDSTGLRHLNNSKSFIEYKNDMDDVYKSIEELNPKNNNAKYWLLLMMWLLICLVIT